MKIIILGSLAKQKHFPEDLTNCEVWGLNAIRHEWVPRWDRMFNLHLYDALKRHKWRPEYFGAEVLFSAMHPEVPFYTLDEWPKPHKLMGWNKFPHQEIRDNFPRGSYHCGSFDWLVAFAVWLHWNATFEIKEIALHGVSLTLEAGEPISARACLEYWCGFADGIDIKVTTAEDCDLFYYYHLVKSDLTYGLDDTPIFEDRCGQPKVVHEKAPYDYEK